jgi:hypothetical protein
MIYCWERRHRRARRCWDGFEGGKKGKRAGRRMRGGSAETSCWIPVRTNAERSTGESDWRGALLAGRLPRRRMQPR